MTAGIIKEEAPGERRVALVPSALAAFSKTPIDFLMQSGPYSYSPSPIEARKLIEADGFFTPR